MGMRFCLKSPAVGSMKRHWPEDDLSETDVNARVAVVSRSLDSAAAEGWRTPPARETGTGVVGFVEGILPFGAEVAAGDALDAMIDEEATSATLVLDLTADEETTAATLEAAGASVGRIMVMTVVMVHPELDAGEVVAMATASDVVVASASGEELAEEAALPVPASELPPNVKVCVASPALQGA